MRDPAGDGSEENSSSADHTDDSDNGRSKKRSRPAATLGQSSDDNSADSHSAEQTHADTHDDTDTEEQPSTTPVSEDRSSQETDGPVDTHRVRKTLSDTHRGSAERGVGRLRERDGVFRTSSVAAETASHDPDQSQETRRTRGDETQTTADRQGGTGAVKQTSASAPRNASQDVARGSDHVEISNRTVGSPNRVSTRVGGPDTDQQREEGIASSESQLRRTCAEGNVC
ncbi:uncharacterized protein LOC143491488 [Brachyhypopomus gauderio]|uniref:uncharacterized protein LOC143491488 n=1 Tax=Brachyhypopomus gauderio TaxID=698409 RepID=UPI0040421C07